MIWQTQEYQGILSLDSKVVDQLSIFLEKKESQLSKHVLSSIHPFQEVVLPPILDPVEGVNFHLNEAVDNLTKKVAKLESSAQKLPKEDWKIAAEEINQGLWEYVELLESCVVELFQQLEQMGFEVWDLDLCHTVSSIKELLHHKIESTLWAIKRLNHTALRYRRLCEPGIGWFFMNSHPIDKELSSNLIKTQKYLGFNFQKFNDRYKGFIQLYSETDRDVQKFYNCRVLTAQEIDFQEKLKKMYFLLHIWELNKSSKTLPSEDVVRALRNEIVPEEGRRLLQDYINKIKMTIFEKSLMLKKSDFNVFEGREGRILIKTLLSDYREEIQLLGEFVDTYESFIQDTDPKVHSHQFWMPLRNSPQLKHFSSIRSEHQKLDHLCEKFQIAIEHDPQVLKQNYANASKELTRLLHEMGQPLISESLMRSKAQSAVNLFNEMDEVGSTDPNIVLYMTTALSKAMLVDWKYHVFFDIPQFHEIYEINKNLSEVPEERQHLNRLNKFKKLIDHLSTWVKHGDSLKRFNEIEYDVNDIKVYLQDFLAYIQRLSKEDLNRMQALEIIEQATYKLSEYQYLFGKFFHSLQEHDAEEKLLRKQLLFVDQYFENIDTRIQEIKEIHLL